MEQNNMHLCRQNVDAATRLHKGRDLGRHSGAGVVRNRAVLRRHLRMHTDPSASHARCQIGPNAA